jgi:hypothetical protein
MQRIDFWFDPSRPTPGWPSSALPQALQGCSYEVDYRPVLFAGLLQHWGQKGPAEIEPKRAWTFRQVHWLAAQHGIRWTRRPRTPSTRCRCCGWRWPARRPPAEPACAVEAVLPPRVGGWRRRRGDPTALAALHSTLAPLHDPPGDAGQAGTARQHRRGRGRTGLFGVPTLSLHGRHFWGLDALPMLRDALRGGAWFDGPAWAREGEPRPGVQRQ